MFDEANIHTVAHYTEIGFLCTVEHYKPGRSPPALPCQLQSLSDLNTSDYFDQIGAPMTAYGYLTTFTGSPEHHAQYYGVLAFAANNRLGPVHFVNESASPTVPGTKPVLAGMVTELLPEDTLIVNGFRALGSTTVEILNVLSTLSRRGVRLYVVNSGFRLDTNVEAQVVATACSLIAQVEADLVTCCPASKTVQESPAECQPPQQPLRRHRKSRLDGKEDEILTMLRDGATLAEIARIVEANRQTVADFITARDLAPR
jgi:DNA invertase Pin-like site-specific DNA recombinase